jgi:hypothetical protein
MLIFQRPQHLLVKASDFVELFEPVHQFLKVTPALSGVSSAEESRQGNEDLKRSRLGKGYLLFSLELKMGV